MTEHHPEHRPVFPWLGSAVLRTSARPSLRRTLQNVLHHRNRCTGQRQAFDIEWRGHQGSVLCKHEVSGGRVARDAPAIRFAFLPSAVVHGNLAGVRGEEDALALGQQLRPVVAWSPLCRGESPVAVASGVRYLLNGTNAAVGENRIEPGPSSPQSDLVRRRGSTGEPPVTETFFQ